MFLGPFKISWCGRLLEFNEGSCGTCTGSLRLIIQFRVAGAIGLGLYVLLGRPERIAAVLKGNRRPTPTNL